MSKDDPGYTTLSKPVGYLYGFLFIVVVVLAIVMPIVTKKDTEDIVASHIQWSNSTTYKPIEFDQFQESIDPFIVWDVSDEAKKVFSELDLLGKLGQVSLWDCEAGLTGPGLDLDYVELAQQGAAGTYINAIHYEDVKKYQDAGMDAGHPPTLFAFDTIHGFSTIFPINLGMSCSWDPSMVESAANFAAKEMKAEGILATFAPMVDVSRDARWGRIMESSGEDPYLNGLFGAATVRGFQSEGVAACVKHLAAYGLPEAGLDYMATRASLLELHNDHMKSFHYAMMQDDLEADPADQAWMAMASYHLISGIPAHGHTELMTDVVRGRWAWHGLMVADYGGVYQQITQKYVKDRAEAFYTSIGAGINQNMGDGAYWNIQINDDHLETNLQNLYRNHTFMDHLDMAVKRVIALKDKLGLFTTPLPDPPAADVHYSTAAMTAARTAAEKSAVLLKNDNSALPMAKLATSNILVVGALADSVRDVLGSWTGRHSRELYDPDTNPDLFSHTTTYLQGIKAMFTRATTTYEQGYVTSYDATGDRKVTNDALNDEALLKLVTTLDESTSDFTHIIAVVGEEGRSQGEAVSRTSLQIGGGQMAVLEALERYRASHPATKIILVYNAGRPLSILYESRMADAILYMWSPGMAGGTALGRLLSNDASPSGRLTVSFPRSVGQCPIYYGRHPSGRPSQRSVGDAIVENINGIPNPNFTSDYIDEYTEPLYPFGYGLTYGTFTINNRLVSPTQLSASEGGTITVTGQVTLQGGTGSSARPMVDVVQVYMKPIKSKMSHPHRKLVGFQRVQFASASATQTSFSIDIDVKTHFGYYDHTLEYVVEPTKYRLFIQRNAAEVTEGVEIVLTE